MLIKHTQLTRGMNPSHDGTRHGGFTLIELLVVIAIISLLMALLISGVSQATKSAKRSASQRSAAALVQAIEQFQSEFGFLPPLVHDGRGVSANSDDYRPVPLSASGTPEDGPIIEQEDGPYLYKTVVVWSEGLDFDFFRRRTGTGSDLIDLSTGGEWDTDGAWEDRRYSKYSLAFYLTGALDKDVDGVRGPGFARPIIDGSYLGVGYPVGSSRDRFEPMMDVDRRGVRLEISYVEPNEYPEHLTDNSDPLERSAIYSDYEDYQQDALVSLVDGFGNAYRYYRWESGRFVNGLLVVENTLDLNIPPVLIDPTLLASLENEAAQANDIDLTAGDIKLRDARYAVVSAGPDGLFGIEGIKTIADHLREAVPTDLDEIAHMRQSVWFDNAVEIGN